MSEARDAGDAGVPDAGGNEPALWGGTQSFSHSSGM